MTSSNNPRRPMPMREASSRELEAMWQVIEADERKAFAWLPRGWALVAATMALLVATAAGAVVIRMAVMRERETEAWAKAHERHSASATTAQTPLRPPPETPLQEAARADTDQPAPAPAPTRWPVHGKHARVKPLDTAEEPEVQPEAPAAEVVAAEVDVFEQGSDARRRRDFRAALALYEQFVDENPTSPRAAVAALECARILADNLGEPERALQAAKRASTLARGTLREDARARVIELLGSTGQNEACLTDQRSFMADYPESAHGVRIMRACK